MYSTEPMREASTNFPLKPGTTNVLMSPIEVLASEMRDVLLDGRDESV